MFKSIANYLHLRDVGILELLLAMSSILVRYVFSFIPFSLLLPIVMIGITWGRHGKVTMGKNKPISWFLIYYLIHQIVWLFLMKNGVPSYYFNSVLANSINILAILVVGYELDYKKLVGSINWVALLSMVGMVYHFSLALRGGSFTPLNLPFLSGLEADDWSQRDEAFRPMSFYSEPGAYVAFMLIPLFIAMSERKFIWAAAIVLTIFMSSSTTGLVSSFLIVGFFIFTQKERGVWIKILSVAFMGIMVVVLTQTELFNQGVEKLNNTDLETTTRTIQGPVVVSSMSGGDFVFGVPYADAYDYCSHNAIGSQVVYYGKTVYMATFWNLILLYGVVGLCLYLNIFVFFLKRNRLLLPYIICLVAVLFSSATFISIGFTIQFCFIMAFHRYCVKTGIVKQNK